MNYASFKERNINLSIKIFFFYTRKPTIQNYKLLVQFRRKGPIRAKSQQIVPYHHCFGLPSLLNMIENRRRKFLDRFFDDTRFSALCGAFIRFTCL